MYIITDWCGNICFNSDTEDFNTFDDASEYLDRMIEQELAEKSIQSKNTTKQPTA